MKNRRPATQSLWLGLALSLACAVSVGAQTFEVVHSFIKDDPQAGSAPIDLVKGDGATLYGATLFGGPSCRWTGYCGVVFAMDSTTNPRPIHDLGWSYDKPDVRLSWSNAGRLYVTAGSWSGGQLLRLTPTVDGPWNVERLHLFPTDGPGFKDGRYPREPVLPAADGRLYSTTWSGGNPTGGPWRGFQFGTAYRLWPDGTGYERLHSFTNNDCATNGTMWEGTGAHPMGALVEGVDGHLYGTTWEGGSPHCYDPSSGTVFRIRADTLQVERVHVFAYQTGGAPHAGLVRGPGGRLFGTTTSIPGGSGTVFGMTVAPEAGATATVTHLHTFTNEEEGNPMTELVWAPDGFLYGTALGGLNRYGLVFRIRPDGTGYEVVHKFTGADGAWPGSRLVAGADGALYGSARDGGPGEGGVIYRIRLSPEAIIGSLIGKVEGLGTLKPGQGKSLVGKLELALQRLQAGDTLKAITMLEAFIHEVRAFENAGILDPAQADGWIATAEGVIASISG